jgi:hypothetical protein
MVNRPGASNRFAVAESSELSISMSVMDRHEGHPPEFEPLAELIEIAKRRAILIERMSSTLSIFHGCTDSLPADGHGRYCEPRPFSW